MLRSILQYLFVLHSPNLNLLFFLTWSTYTTYCGFCPWPAFYTWVTMVRKKWLSLYYNAYECYIHQNYTNCSSWHDLLMPPCGLCPWLSFHASVTKTQNGNCGSPVMVPITIMSSSHTFDIKNKTENVILLEKYLIKIYRLIIHM